MIKQTSKKIVQIGRGMVLCVGLAVVLAVTLGTATTALAGTGVGDAFDLGKLNTVNRISSLVGSTAGVMLKVDNNGTGPAMSLESGAGQTPLTVNSTAGTAINLSADKLDGKDSADFLPVDTYSSESPLTSGQDIGNGTGNTPRSVELRPWGSVVERGLPLDGQRDQRRGGGQLAFREHLARAVGEHREPHRSLRDADLHQVCGHRRSRPPVEIQRWARPSSGRAR